MFNPHQSISELKVFRVTVLVLFSLALISFTMILCNDELHFSPNHQGFNNFFNVFKFPLAVLTCIIPAVALIATNHRSEQTKEQIRLTNSQNNFTNYYKHIEEFEKYHEKSLNKLYYSFDVRHLHSVVFDRAKDGNYFASVKFLTRLVEYSHSMLLLLSSPEKNNEERLQSFVDFLDLQHDFHNEFQIPMPGWSSTTSIDGQVIPGNFYEIILSITQLVHDVNVVYKFDTNYKEPLQVSNLSNLDLSNYKNVSSFGYAEIDYTALYQQLTYLFGGTTRN